MLSAECKVVEHELPDNSKQYISNRNNTRKVHTKRWQIKV